MAICKDICCEQLICDLQDDSNLSVLLYTVDGFSYYGQIKKIIDHKIALLVPGLGQNQVIIRHPDQTFCPQGTSIIREDFTYLDLCKVVATTTNLISIPDGFIPC
ncbi:hypothetical protein [Sporomusa aerivorans]|uniref:hypothetical protein n=1 Tax=Sporomusa aerivorans TaxID=204936 RepID=UPI00352A8C35